MMRAADAARGEQDQARCQLLFAAIDEFFQDRPLHNTPWGTGAPITFETLQIGAATSSSLTHLFARCSSRGVQQARMFNVINEFDVAVYLTDAAGFMIFYNDTAAELWGWQPALLEQRWCGSWRLVTQTGAALPHDQCPMAVSIREGRPHRGAWAYAERPDGRRVPFAPFAAPVIDERGTMGCAINVLLNLAEAKSYPLRTPPITNLI